MNTKSVVLTAQKVLDFLSEEQKAHLELLEGNDHSGVNAAFASHVAELTWILQDLFELRQAAKIKPKVPTVK